MIPSRFVRLESLPTTVHGKVDRAALVVPPADPRSHERPDEETFVAPRTGLEVAIARVWSEVLRVERVGVRDNFFDLGGDSILAIQIVARCHRAGLKLTPAQLFENLTVEALARVCGAVEEEAEIVEEPAGPVPLEPGAALVLRGRRARRGALEPRPLGERARCALASRVCRTHWPRWFAGTRPCVCASPTPAARGGARAPPTWRRRP